MLSAVIALFSRPIAAGAAIRQICEPYRKKSTEPTQHHNIINKTYHRGQRTGPAGLQLELAPKPHLGCQLWRPKIYSESGEEAHAENIVICFVLKYFLFVAGCAIWGGF